jgi:membrane protein
VAQRVWSESNRDNLSVVAAGCAFFALFAIFPALSALISLYGLTADPSTVEREFGMLGSVLCAGGGGEMQVPRRGRNAADAPRP